ncbi:hypothetical protein DFH29DRAFT_1083476 [Suillus ampliporus]|nr:hypothetical protein DFH29DRAFT_1083476 [Suillus ampliporus]
MPIEQADYSLLPIRQPPDIPENQPHPLHVFIEPLLISLRAAANKYHNELPQILTDGGCAGEAEETVMWYALGYGKTDARAECSATSTEKIYGDLISLSAWSSIQILLYFLKLSLPGLCTPLSPVEVPPTDNVYFYFFISPIKPTCSRKKPRFITPSSIDCLESFMDKLSMSQLVSLMDISRTHRTRHKSERDWMQTFCEDIVEPLYMSTSLY